MPKKKNYRHPHKVYGAWAGKPNGTLYDPERCAVKVWVGAAGMTSAQCSRPARYGRGGLYCAQHARMVNEGCIED